MEIQKQSIIDQVLESRRNGRKVKDTLNVLGVKSSSYYRRQKELQKKKSTTVLHESDRITSRSLSPMEIEEILNVKEDNPQMRHRQIQGVLQNKNIYLSASSVFKVLKEHNMVEKYERRPAPWNEPFYEMISDNTMWGADWTKLRIGGERWYLLTMIDFFSRKIIHWNVLRTVTSTDIIELYSEGIAPLNLPQGWHLMPELRVDQGSPNTAHITKRLFKDIEADLSFARVQRPTDNARTERFYGTIKQEEIYLVGDYQNEATAIEEIGKYIDFYNNQRPHQSLWNFTPNQVHEINNKTEILKMLKQLKTKSWTSRKEYWIQLKNKLTTSH